MVVFDVVPFSGNLVVTSLQFQLATDLNATTPNFTLTCISTGGPVTTFSWRRDGARVANNNSYNISPQVVTDGENGTYTHILTVMGRRPGQYECSLTNNRPSMDTGNLTVESKSTFNMLKWFCTPKCLPSIQKPASIPSHLI